MKKVITILQVLIYITYLAELSPFILCLFFYKKIITTELRVFFYYTLCVVFFLIVSLFVKFYLANPILLLIVRRVFLLTEFIFLSLLYSHIVISKLKRIFLPLSIVGFFIYSYYDFYISRPGEFTYMPLVAECFFFIIVIVFFMYEKIQYSISSPLYAMPTFWISVAFLIYFSGNFFLFLFSKSMIQNPDFRDQYTIIYSTVTVMKNIFLCTAIITNSNLVDHDRNSNRKIDIDLSAFNQLPNPITHNSK